MSKPGRRPNREQLKAQIKEKKRVEKSLREELKAKGMTPRVHETISNHKCEYESVAEERTARNEAICEQIQIFRSRLPLLLMQLSKIEDPRNPKKVKHQLTVLILYGILTFIFQMSSCREANREMTRPMFEENLKLLFPEFEEMPHHDTLKRLLSRIDVNEIENIHIDLIRQLIRKKKFRRYLIDKCHPIAVDGTQKLKRDWLWDEECLERTFKNAEGDQCQYYAYVLEANLAFCDGMTIPLMSEFLSYKEGDSGNSKQDCELKAFYRLAERLKKAFPALPIIILLDGLYAKGPVMELCRKNKWQFMIVLKDKVLPSVMEEFDAITRLSSFYRNMLILLSSVKIGTFHKNYLNQYVTLIAIKKLEHRVLAVWRPKTGQGVNGATEGSSFGGLMISNIGLEHMKNKCKPCTWWNVWKHGKRCNEAAQRSWRRVADMFGYRVNLWRNRIFINDAIWGHAPVGLSRQGFWWKSTMDIIMNTASPTTGIA